MAITNNTQFGRTGAFRFWCQKVLPAVYDDSLSYYELLCKVMKWLEDLTNVTNTQSDAIKELQDTLAEFMAGEFDSYIEEKVDKWFDDNEPAIMSTLSDLGDDITAIDNQIATLETDMNSFMRKQAPNNLLMGAKPIYRIETTKDDRIQGGTAFKIGNVLYYALALYSVTNGYADRIVIYNISTDTLESTINGNFAHANSIDYYDGKIYISGDFSSTLVYEYDVTTPASPTLASVIDLSSEGFATLWGFGHYKDGKWWATPDLYSIYVLDENMTNRILLCNQPINYYMTGTQQAITYNETDDMFYSSRSSSFTCFNKDTENNKFFNFDWQYGFCGTYEIQEITKIDNIFYFHNNATYDRGDSIDVHTVFMFDPDEQVTSPVFIGYRNSLLLTNDPDYKIPNFFNGIPTYFYYPQDLRNFIKAYPSQGRYSIELATDIDFVVSIPVEVSSVYCRSHTCTGMVLEGGNNVIIYGLPSYDADHVTALARTVNGNKVLIYGEGSTVILNFSLAQATGGAVFYVASLYGCVFIKNADLTSTYYNVTNSFIDSHN